MSEAHIIGYIASAMQFVVAANALRLNRRYGTAKVGWSLVGAFVLLALVQLVQSAIVIKSGDDAVMKVDATYILISFLLLVGMLHLEAVLKERQRAENLEKQLRADLEEEVKLKTAYLTRAIEELMQQMEETKRVSAILSETTMMNRPPDGSNTTIFDRPPAVEPENGSDQREESRLGGILTAEWIAHF